MSDELEATIRAVRPASITLTLPPAGRSRRASRAASRAAASRFGDDVGRGHARRRVDDEDDVAGEAGGALDERPGGEQHEDDHEQELEQEQEAASQPLPRRVRLDIGDEALPEERGGDDRLLAPELEQVHRDDERARRGARSGRAGS